MTNEQIIRKMKDDMNMRNFSKYTYDSYLGKTRDMMRYYGEKRLEEVTTEELREFLLKYLKDERKLSDRSINYVSGQQKDVLKPSKMRCKIKTSKF